MIKVIKANKVNVDSKAEKVKLVNRVHQEIKD